MTSASTRVTRSAFDGEVAAVDNFDINERAALDRLVAYAQAPTRESKRVADFLFVWWNAETC